MSQNKVARVIRAAIREQAAYHVEPPAGLIKLDAMENPYRLPPEWTGRWLDVLRELELNRYPDADFRDLRNAMKSFLGVPADMELMLGNGSDELIQLLCQAIIDSPLSMPRRPVVLSTEPGFVMYRFLAKACGLEYMGVPLREKGYTLDTDAMLEAIEWHKPALVFLAYPNNPTGNLFKEIEMEKIIAASPGLVVVDEAYHPFAEASFMDRLATFDNLLVMRTVSKLGLAGIRLGALAGSGVWLQELNKLRLPYNINMLTQATARLACEHPDFFAEQAKRIREERQRLYAEMEILGGIRPFPSRANFILFKTPAGQATSIFEFLKANGVLIKNLSTAGGLLHDCLRVTVGTPRDNDVFLSVLRQGLKDV
jgi:histidinol-phosphate aminotransferase